VPDLPRTAIVASPYGERTDRTEWTVESVGPRYVTLTRGNAVAVFSVTNGRIVGTGIHRIVPGSLGKIHAVAARERTRRAGG